MTTTVQHEKGWNQQVANGTEPHDRLATTLIVSSLVGIAIAAWSADAWILSEDRPGVQALRWLLSLLPAAIIVNHLFYLVRSRKKQFREALTGDVTMVNRLEQLYFDTGSMTTRYVIPALFTALLCSVVIAALTHWNEFLPWLSPGGPGKDGLPDTPWGRQLLRGAAFGFVGSYLYMILLLTDRAFRRDVTTGVATWTAATVVLGPLTGGAAALLLLDGAGPPDASSFTRDAVFFVSGMLPRQFATFVQSQVRRMFQSGAPTSMRTMPLTTLRGIGPDVESRLDEEGIHDVVALAYASPHQLIRSTHYAPRQIVDWIDEAMLISTVPQHWEALEKVGVTGAMDLAWYEDHKDSQKALATSAQIDPTLLGDVVTRMWEDAQVRDLYALYWDHAAPSPAIDTRRAQPPQDQTQNNPVPPPPNAGGERPASPPSEVRVSFRFGQAIADDAREPLMGEIEHVAGVRNVRRKDDHLIIGVDTTQRDALADKLREKGLEPNPPLLFAFLAEVGTDARAQALTEVNGIVGVLDVVQVNGNINILAETPLRAAVDEELRRRTDIRPREAVS